MRYVLAGLMFFLLSLQSADLISAEVESADPPAIEFFKGLPWLNVSRPLTLAELRGKVVILDFWTYGCINCMHVLDDLHRLEKKYGNDLVVIGVHTPKFDNEKNLETLRRIVVRYDIEHPVVNDIESKMARLYGMRAWPTQYVIDPGGRVLGKVEGEGNFDVLDKVIGDQVRRYAGKMNSKPLPIKTEKALFAKSLLAAPGKVAASDKLVAISDTLHHRIILADHSGKIVRIIGGSRSGLVDGTAETARFHSPQGLAFSADKLYVADTGNHVIRAIDLASGDVTTVAGNGKMESHRNSIFDATAIGLRSPWALAIDGNTLYIAMAGTHQIWRLDIEANKIRPWAGTGEESIGDGEIRQASFSQPSGLSLYGNSLFVADAEVSAVRQIDVEKQVVKTLVGKGLFEFGDQDGRFDSARLQHVLGVAAADDATLYIADTYNHKIKKLDLKAGKVLTVVGTGKPGKGVGTALESELNEPGGLVVLDGMVLIADTNNNRMMRFDPTKNTVEEWKLSE